MRAYFDGHPLDVTVVQGGGGESAPIGSLTYFLGTEAPDGYLACDGAVHNIADYPDLASFIETQFQTKNHFGGDGETTFAVPDMRGRFLLGSSDTHALGSEGGEEEVTLTVEQMPKHTHTYKLTGSTSSLGTGSSGRYDLFIAPNADSIVGLSGNDQPHNNMPPYTAVLICIKAKASASGGGAATNVPSGGCIIWTKGSDTIPDGWALCDGENGTPDLRDKFVVGAGGKYNVGDTGGEEEVTLTVEQMPTHNHAYYRTQPAGQTTTSTSSSAKTFYGQGAEFASVSAGSSQPHNNLPPYYAVCWIMKL